jgi:hypothetical protein
MKASFFRIILFITILSCITVISWTLDTHNLYRLHSVSADTVNYGMTSSDRKATNLEFQYGQNNFFDLQAISADYIHFDYSGGIGHPVTDSTRLYPYQTNANQSSGNWDIDQQYTGSDTANLVYHEIVRLDSHGRRIYYQVFDSQGVEKYKEEVFYSNGVQPDSMTAEANGAHTLYVFHYDSFNRKSTIDYYRDQIYQGYYSITYLSEYAHPYQFYLPFIGVEDLAFIEMIADQNWRLDHIMFHPANGAEQQELWWCDTENGFYFRYAIDYGEGWGNARHYSFNEQGLLITAAYSSSMDLNGNTKTYTFSWDTIVPVAENVVPQMSVNLQPGYPNPFTKYTTIQYRLAKSSPVKVQIFNIKGQLIKTLETGLKTAGNFRLTWNGTDEQNQTVPNGVYFIRLQAGAERQTTKILKLK